MVTLSKIGVGAVEHEFSFVSMNLSGTIPSQFTTKASKPDYTTVINNVEELLEKGITLTVGLHTDGVSTATVKTFDLLNFFRTNLNSVFTLTLYLDGGALVKTYLGKIEAQHQAGVVSTSPSQNLFSFPFVIIGTTW